MKRRTKDEIIEDRILLVMSNLFYYMMRKKFSNGTEISEDVLKKIQIAHDALAEIYFEI